MINLLIPMSGQGTRYQKEGYSQPKPAIPVNGRPMIARLLSCFPAKWPTFFVMAENHRSTELPSLLLSLRPNGRQDFVAVHTEGPLRAIEEGLRHLPEDQPVLVSYCDYGMIWNAELFEKFVQETNCDACVISYRGFHAHYLRSTQYAYSRLEKDRVREVREKESFTQNRQNEFASSGAYYFKSANILSDAIKFQRQLDLKTNNEFYTSLTIEALLRMNPNADVRVFEIPFFFQWGTPQDLWDFEYWEKCFAAAEKNKNSVAQILMPMAGLGSRFQSLTDIPKPMIPVDGQPMFKKALASLPQGKTILVAREELKKFGPQADHVVFLPETPPGQALSVKEGLSQLDPSKEVMVSSCDHGIVLNHARWEQFHRNPDCDAAIMTIRGFPGADRKPDAYAYVSSRQQEHPFPEVAKVSVKKPISAKPRQDSLLVGTFWFRSASTLEQAINDLIKADVRVNHELYLDSVFELMISKGQRVREILLDGYLNWGDPESMNEALYWEKAFACQGQGRTHGI